MLRRFALAAPLVASAIAVGGAAPPAPSPRPPPALAEAYKGCRWERVTSRTLSIWSYACGKDMGRVRLRPDDAAAGFALISDGDQPRAVIRTFAKAAAAPVPSILPTVLRATGPHKASCRLVEHRRYGEWGTVWSLEPTGREKAAYDAANQVEPQENPCGELGIGPAGDRFFRVLRQDTTRVIYADMGSEVQVFDLNSLRPHP